VKASILVLAALSYTATSPAFAKGSHATDQKPGPTGIVIGECLAAARAKLLKGGWESTLMHTTDGYEHCGVERALASGQSFELDTCSFDGSRCVLYHSKKGTCLRRHHGRAIR